MYLIVILTNKLDLNQETHFTILFSKRRRAAKVKDEIISETKFLTAFSVDRYIYLASSERALRLLVIDAKLISYFQYQTHLVFSSFGSSHTWHNDTQHIDTQCNDTQHNDTQHNDTQRNYNKQDDTA